MPLPWKKTKVSPFSRIVADLQPPNRGNSSLVVETGFPTSLVDLFVKNRDRLKKARKSKKSKSSEKKRECVKIIEEEDLVISDPILLPSSSDLENISGSACLLELKNENSSRRNSDGDNKVLVVEINENGGYCDGHVVGEEKRRLLVTIMKMFMMVILALSNKKLVVGVTVSAFMLILLEYVGKHVLCLFSPCEKARVALEPLTRRVLSFFNWVNRFVILFFYGMKVSGNSKEVIARNEGDSVDDCCDIVSDSCNSLGNVDSRSPSDEIQLAESDSVGDGNSEANGQLFQCDSESSYCVMAERNRGVMEVENDKIAVSSSEKLCSSQSTKLVRCDSESGYCLIVERNVGVTDVENGKIGILSCEKARGSQRAKFKSKILNKLVRKNLKRKNEKQTDLVSDTSSSVGITHDLVDGENGVKQDLVEEDQEEIGGGYIMRNVEEELMVDTSSRSSELNANSGADLINGRVVEIRNNVNSGFIIVFLTVLCGLTGGRIVAFLVTVASWLMFKFVETRKT